MNAPEPRPGVDPTTSSHSAPSRSDEHSVTLFCCFVDAPGEYRRFSTLEEARVYAREMLGPNPERTPECAVSDDGSMWIEADGFDLDELFVGSDDGDEPE